MSDYKHIDVTELTGAFCFEHGIHHPDWAAFHDWIEQKVSGEDHEAAWNELVVFWLKRLQADLGGNYHLLSAGNVMLLCDLSPETGRTVLDHCQRSVRSIKECLRETAWRGGVGKDVVLIFSNDEDYYRYLSHYSLDGEQAGSSGMSIRAGYTHIAIPFMDPFQVAHAIVHELTHDSVAHLRLPNWLNEALALNLEKVVMSLGSTFQLSTPLMWDELAERHFAFWNEVNIQHFWAGKSFYEPGDSNELSYSLAEVLLKLMSDQCKPASFTAFLETASYDDAGEAAALSILKVDLGTVAATFLGEGEWRPKPAMFEQIWKRHQGA